MSALFQELAYSETAIGVLSLRRRKDLSLGIDIYEIKLDDEELLVMREDDILAVIEA